MALVAPPPHDLVGKNSQLFNPSEDHRINVFFRFVDGKSFCLLVNPYSEDIMSIKERLVTKYHQRQQQTNDNTSYTGTFFGGWFILNANDLVFMWNGKPIDDSGVLAEYNLVKENATTMHVSVRNRGGCFIFSFTILMVILMSLIGSTCTCGLSLIMVPLLLPFLFILPLFCL